MIFQVINWLGGTDVLEVEGVIEMVTEDMLDNIIESEDDVLVFFYDEEETEDVEGTVHVLNFLANRVSQQDC